MFDHLDLGGVSLRPGNPVALQTSEYPVYSAWFETEPPHLLMGSKPPAAESEYENEKWRGIGLLEKHFFPDSAGKVLVIDAPQALLIRSLQTGVKEIRLQAYVVNQDSFVGSVASCDT